MQKPSSKGSINSSGDSRASELEPPPATPPQLSPSLSESEARADEQEDTSEAKHHYNQNLKVGWPRVADSRYRGGYLDQPTKTGRGWKIATLLLSITTIVLFASTAILAFDRFNHFTTFSTPQTTSIPVDATATSTPVPTPTPVVQPSATVRGGLLQKNLTLSCSGCDDPIHVTIKTIEIDNANGRMIWDTHFRDITNSGTDFEITEYNLQVGSSQANAPAVLSQLHLSGKNQYDMQATFAFIPFRDVTYTLSVALYFSGSGVSVTFIPVKINF